MSTYTSFAPDWREPPTPTTSFLDPDLSYDDDMDEKMSEKSSDLSSDDLEAQSIFKEEMRNKDGPILAAEYRTSMRVKLMYLSGYFLLNLSLTLYNKALLGNFHFPWLLTALHSTCAFSGCYMLEAHGYFKASDLGKKENIILAAFSVLFTVNIAMSNVSLEMVSVPFHQIIRSTTPVFAILVHRVVYQRTYSVSTYLSLIPLIVGVGFTTYGDYYFTTLGFFCTLAGTVLAAVKTIATNRLMTGSLALPALEILLRMSPLAAIQSLIVSAASGEMQEFADWLHTGHLTRATALALLGNGAIAFLLNVSSFQTNKIAGALTITVCGNVKQCLTILFGIALFNVRVDSLNGFGMAMALGGAAWYSCVELKRKMRPAVVNSSPIPDK